MTQQVMQQHGESLFHRRIPSLHASHHILVGPGAVAVAAILQEIASLLGWKPHEPAR